MKLALCNKRGILYSLIIFSILVVLFSIAISAAPMSEKAGAVTRESQRDNDQSLSLQLEKQIQSSITTGSSVNLNTPEYRDNPEVAKGVLKEKFNIDINSFTGVKIESGILKVGTSEIDLQAGKQIKLEIQGNTIIKYEDGQTTILNEIGRAS